MDDTLRVEKGSQPCQLCGSKEGVNQLVEDKKIKGLPVQLHKFICLPCVVEETKKETQDEVLKIIDNLSNRFKHNLASMRPLDELKKYIKGHENANIS